MATTHVALTFAGGFSEFHPAKSGRSLWHISGRPNFITIGAHPFAVLTHLARLIRGGWRWQRLALAWRKAVVFPTETLMVRVGAGFRPLVSSQTRPICGGWSRCDRPVPAFILALTLALAAPALAQSNDPANEAPPTAKLGVTLFMGHGAVFIEHPEMALSECLAAARVLAQTMQLTGTPGLAVCMTEGGEDDAPMS